jgi:hypothetical protein
MIAAPKAAATSAWADTPNFLINLSRELKMPPFSGDGTEHKHATGNVVIKRQLGDIMWM